VLVRQCLARRVADRETVQQIATRWAAQRNRTRATVDWRFTVRDARIKLHRLYPPEL
jgi:hypothetical protein